MPAAAHSASPGRQAGPSPASEQALERQADRAAEQVVLQRFAGVLPGLAALPGGTGIQRKCACGGTCDKCKADAEGEDLRIQRAPDGAGAPAAAPAPPAASAVQAPAGQVLVDDGAAVAPGQMARGAFMAALRAQLTAVCDQELAAVGRSAEGCPYLQQWLGYYEGRPAAVIERSAQRYTGGTPKNAQELLGTIVGRVRGAVKLWATTGSMSGVPDAAASAAAAVGDLFGGLLQFKVEAGAAAPAAHPAAVRAQLGAGRSLEPGLRGRMEQGFGTSFSKVRVHTDSTASQLSRGLSARAFTVGQDVAFGAGQYRPGTVAGDLLIAHELAHTLQQSGERVASPGGEATFEEDADRAAVAAVSLGTGVPRQRTGLRFQGCSSDKKEDPLAKIKDLSDPRELAEALQGLSDADLDTLQGQAKGGGSLADGLRWEKAFRGKKWGALASLAKGKGGGFQEAYSPRVVAVILSGKTSIKVDPKADETFRSWIEARLTELGSKPVGFRLLVELLATGQPVQFKSTTEGHTTNPDLHDSFSEGKLVTTDDEGKPLPPGQQKRGKPVGSFIALNPAEAENEVSLGGTKDKPAIIDMDPTVTVGHELIHALHNARGENRSSGFAALRGVTLSGLVRDPMTGQIADPEELGTITGQSRFQPPAEEKGQANWALDFRDDDPITENMLRRERGLPERQSHTGGRRAAAVAVKPGETVDQLLNHYSLKGGGAVPPALRAEIRSVLLEWYPQLAKPLPEGIEHLDLPQAGYMNVHLLGIRRNPDLADQAGKLQVR